MCLAKNKKNLKILLHVKRSLQSKLNIEPGKRNKEKPYEEHWQEIYLW